MNKVDISRYGEFKLEDIFTIKSPKARVENHYQPGDMPYVSSLKYNNGVKTYLEPMNKEDFEDGNCITVNPLDGTSFYQRDRFLGRGGSGASILLLYNENLEEYNALFVCTAIKKAATIFGYSDLLNGDNLKQLVIKLPIIEDGNIDWEYMGKYMESMEEKADNRLRDLVEIIGGAIKPL